MRLRLRVALACFVLMLSVFTKTYAQVNSKTQAQIMALIEEKASRTPAQKKISSMLLQAIREAKGQKMAPGTFLEPANVDADAAGNLEIDIRAFVDDRIIAKISNLGAKVTYEGFGFNMIRAKVNFSIIEAIAALEEVKYISPAERGQIVGAGLTGNQLSGNKNSVITPASKSVGVLKPTIEQRGAVVRARIAGYLQRQQTLSFFTGSTNSQGDKTHRTEEARNVFGALGQGMKIGVISDSYGRFTADLANDIATGNLPGPGNPNGNTTAVTIVQDFAGTDEGRAMMHIVHDIAPQAQLFFATANVGGQAGFAANILALRNTYACDVIIDDIYYFAEAVFQDGTVAQAVNTVTQGSCFYFSSAGNAGSVLRNTAGVWEGDFNDAGSPVFINPTGDLGTVHNFGNSLLGDVVTLIGSRYNLSWSDPAFASTNDYDFFLVSSTGTVKNSATGTQDGTQPPYEEMTVPALVAGDMLVVFKPTAAAVRAIAVNTNRGVLATATNGQTHGHNSTVLGYGVAATPAATPFGASVAGPFPSPFSGTNQTETFSSDGPRRIFYNENGTPVTPGNVLFGTNGGTVRNKPDFTAADGVTTNMPAGGLNPFYGTSAAAPHAGAIAALIKSVKPTITVAEMRTALVSTAVDIEGAGYDITSGAGIIQAYQAIQSLALVPVSNISLGTTTITEAAGQNNSGGIDPGENGNIVVQLNNATSVTATTVGGVLSTTTPGVTITQNTAAYGNIGALGNGSNTAAPFLFSVDPSVPCGTVINFNITVTFGGGGVSPQIFNFKFPVGNVPGASISNTLGNAPASQAGFTSASGTINQRLNRSGGGASVCGVQKANPGLLAATGTRLYHSFTFLNTGTASQCVSVNLTAANGGNMFVAAYNNSGFVPATPSVNYLADAASSAAAQSFSFTAPAGQFFTVVVNEVNVGTASGSPYNLSVSLAICTPVALPLTWLDFTAQPKNSSVALQWKVANEINLNHYEVEYGTDGRNFSKLFSVSANRASSLESTYDQTHAWPVNGNNYYRIKQVDNDGRSTYSATRLVKMNDVKIVSMSPNPASTVVNVRSADMMKTIRVYNSTGQLVMSEKPAGNSYVLNVAKLTAGTYTVKIETDNTVVTQKLVKEN